MDPWSREDVLFARRAACGYPLAAQSFVGNPPVVGWTTLPEPLRATRIRSALPVPSPVESAPISLLPSRHHRELSDSPAARPGTFRRLDQSIQTRFRRAERMPAGQAFCHLPRKPGTKSKPKLQLRGEYKQASEPPRTGRFIMHRRAFAGAVATSAATKRINLPSRS